MPRVLLHPKLVKSLRLCRVAVERGNLCVVADCGQPCIVLQIDLLVDSGKRPPAHAPGTVYLVKEKQGMRAKLIVKCDAGTDIGSRAGTREVVCCSRP